MVVICFVGTVTDMPFSYRPCPYAHECARLLEVRQIQPCDGFRVECNVRLRSGEEPGERDGEQLVQPGWTMSCRENIVEFSSEKEKEVEKLCTNMSSKGAALVHSRGIAG